MIGHVSERCLSTLDLALLGVGAMVGSGLTSSPEPVAKDMAGPAVVISFLVAGVASLMAALCYAEFGAVCPKTGSAYMFTHVSVGSGDPPVQRGGRDPQKSVPIATAISLALAATAYILVSMVLTLMVPWNTLDPNSAFSDAFYRRGYSWAGFIVAVGSICAMNTVLLSNLFSLPRIVYAMAEDGLFFSVFSRVNPVTKVPVIAILVFGSLMSVLALIFDLEALVQFLSIGTLLAYTFVAASVIVLRFQPEKHTTAKKDAPAPWPGQQSNSGSKLKDWAPGEVVTFSVLALMVSAVSLSARLFFEISYLERRLWSFVLLLVIFSLAFLLTLFVISIRAAAEHQDLPGSFGAVCTWCQHPAECVSHDEAQFSHLGPIHHLGSCRAVGVFRLRIWHSKEGLKEPQCVSAPYVVLPSGSLVETVQNVQPEGHTHAHTPATNAPTPAADDPQANR
ncbi:hypothetical protein AMELA_G00295990 [Ameiurus melas]|uniref:Amino acid permease/ SLC12A domain-containing protein n=1 Tax=Ameiurus melas TaxID=219545 RepID=A0A7J5ZIB9_AMEME|nr:hypothetical protein AMELA_G00295990 [Ameiurus melas]